MSPSWHACATLHLGNVGGGFGEAAAPGDPAFAFLGMPTRPWLGLGSDALGRAQTPNSNAAVAQTAPCCSRRAALGQGLDNLPFSPGKINPSGLLTHAAAGSRKRGVEGCLPPSLPSLPLHHQSCPASSWHFIPQKQQRRVGSSHRACRSSARWLPGSPQSSLFLAFHLAACTSIPNPLQPFACLPRGAAPRVLFTV